MTVASVYEKYYERQPGVVKVIAVTGIALLGYTIYRRIRHNQEVKEANTAGDIALSEIQKLANQGVYATYTDAQYEAFSQALVQSMNGCGSDMNKIKQVFSQLQNDADIQKLIAQFGVRYIEPCWYSQADAYAIWLFNDQAYGGGLPTWLSFKLDSSEIVQVNGILRSKGVNYQF